MIGGRGAFHTVHDRLSSTQVFLLCYRYILLENMYRQLTHTNAPDEKIAASTAALGKRKVKSRGKKEESGLRTGICVRVAR